MWLVRNPDGKNKFGTLCLFKNKPIRGEKSWIPVDYENNFPIGVFSYMCGIDEKFPKLKWEDEPIEVELSQISKTREYAMIYYLKKAYDIANEGDSWITNDSLGCAFCKEIKNMIQPVIDRVQKDINDYQIKE